MLILGEHHVEHHAADDLEALFARLRDEDIANNAPARIATLENIIARLRAGEALSQEQIRALLAELNTELEHMESGDEDDIPPYEHALTEAQIQAILAGQEQGRTRRSPALNRLAEALQLVNRPAEELATLVPHVRVVRHDEADDLEALFDQLRNEDIANNAPTRIAALEAIIARLRRGETLSQEQIRALLAELNMELQNIDSDEEDDIPPYVAALTETQIQAILAGELPERPRRSPALELLATTLQLVDQPAARLAELLPNLHEAPNELARLFQRLREAQNETDRHAVLEVILTWLQKHDGESILPLNTAQVKLLLGLLGIDPKNISDAEDVSVAFQLIRENLDENGSSEFDHRDLILSIIYTSADQQELSAAELVYKAIRQGSKVPPLVLNSQQQTHQVHQVHDPDELNTLFQNITATSE